MILRPDVNQSGPADVLVIRGGQPLAGSVRISGYKHATVPMLAAAALASGRVELTNVPDIEDRRVLCEIFAQLGAAVTFDKGRLTIDPNELRSALIPEALSSRVHGTLYLLPTLLGRFGSVEMGSVGGCVFGRRNPHGSRPIYHVTRMLERFGARFDITSDSLSARLPRGRYRSARVSILDYYDDRAARTGPLASGATKAALLAASVADGTSTIEHPLRTAEIMELIAFLRSAGAAIDDCGTQLTVQGRDELAGGRHGVMSDPMEAFTYAACAVYTGGSIALEGLTAERLRPALAHETERLEQMGIEAAWSESTLHLSATDLPLRGVDLEILPVGSVHPDNQPLFSLLLLLADRPCSVVDRVWSSRFAYATELVRIGARVEVGDGELRTYPGRPMRTGQDIRGSDLRCACVLLVAALAIEGGTTLRGASHLRRGYDDIVGKLVGLGADIQVVSDHPVQGLQERGRSLGGSH